MSVHNVIKVEIKQTKMNFFCLHFNPVFSRNSLTTHVLHVHHIGVMSHFAYVELRITRSIFAIPLDFEIARLTCICIRVTALDLFKNFISAQYLENKWIEFHKILYMHLCRQDLYWDCYLLVFAYL